MSLQNWKRDLLLKVHDFFPLTIVWKVLIVHSHDNDLNYIYELIKNYLVFQFSMFDLSFQRLNYNLPFKKKIVSDCKNTCT